MLPFATECYELQRNATFATECNICNKMQHLQQNANVTKRFVAFGDHCCKVATEPRSVDENKAAAAAAAAVG